MKNNLLKIINNYGLIEQFKYFQSEVFELNEAILRYDEAAENFFDGKYNNEEIEKAEKVNSNTQLYKQAGNSICVPVLEAIFKNLLKDYLWSDLD